MNPLRFFTLPEYFFNPRQVIRRFFRGNFTNTPLETDVRLPWNAVVTVCTKEALGYDLYLHGIYDKVVPETLWRLLDRGETAVDVGANIGQNTSLMACRSGAAGKVISFEPHPEILAELHTNQQRWDSSYAPIVIHPVALGAEEREDTIANEGGRWDRAASKLQSTQQTAAGFPVNVRRLDDYLSDVPAVGVMKIDVEGFELGVVQGASKTLLKGKIRDIVFEDFNPQPSAVSLELQRYGFYLFALQPSWLRPHLRELSLPRTTPGFSCNYLATLDPARAIQRFAAPGWRCLMGF